MSVWQALWLIFVSFAFVAYMLLLFFIISDLFRDQKTSGWVKALWVLFLFLIPLITALVYLLVRGGGMAERTAAAENQARAAEKDYIRTTAGTNHAAQIADAKQLLDNGTISAQEFERLKEKALA